MKLTFLQWLVQGVPECLALATFGWVLLKDRFNVKKILSIGFLHAIIIFLVRNLPLPFGIHTVILIFTLAALLVFFTASSYSKALFVSLVAIVILGLAEMLVLIVAGLLFGLTEEAVFANQFLRVVLGLPQVVILFVITYFIAYLKKRKIRAGKAETSGLKK